jgi:hypothetical protein
VDAAENGFWWALISFGQLSLRGGVTGVPLVDGAICGSERASMSAEMRDKKNESK